MDDLIAVTRRIFDPSFLDPSIRERVLSRVHGPEGPKRTLGWDVAEGPETSAGASLGARLGVVGHLGFTGTSLWVDQQSGWAFSVLTGRVHLGREHLGIRKFRPRIHEALTQDLGIFGN
jgi:CubicO group peptidase (beta-lactamase class C family)